MIWSLKQCWLLSRLFVCQVLLLFVDVVTDVKNGIQLLQDQSEEVSQIGMGMLVLILMPGIGAILANLVSLIGSSFHKKPRQKFHIKTFKDIIEELPVTNIICKFFYFLRLCFVDTNCPHNFGLISDIRNQIISSSLNEAFLESAPQLVLQAAFLHYKRNVLFVLGVTSSFLSCSFASVNLYLFCRPGYYSDCNPSWKSRMIVFPLVMTSIMGGIFLWSAACRVSPKLAGLCFLVILLITFSSVFGSALIMKVSKQPKFLMNEVVSFWIAPFAPWRPRSERKSSRLLLKLFIGSMLPFSITMIVTSIQKIEFELISHTIVPYIFLVTIFTSWILVELGNYKKLYSVSKVLKVFNLKPVVHRSMIFGLLQNLENDDNGNFPDYFYTFLENPTEINQPDPEDWNTVMHFAFYEKQFAALILMIQHGGNPFIRNRAGKSIESILETLDLEQSSIKDQLVKEIEAFRQKFPPEDKESLVHKAARNNSLRLLNVYRFLNGSFDSFNNKRQKPVEVSMENGHLEASLYLMQSMTDAFEDQEIGQKCLKFLKEQALASAFTPDLALLYIKVIIGCLKFQDQDDEEIEKIVGKLEESKKSSKDDFNLMLLESLSQQSFVL